MIPSENKAALMSKEALLEELRIAERAGVRVAPNNVIAAADLIKQGQARAFLNGFGCLCLRSA